MLPAVMAVEGAHGFNQQFLLFGHLLHADENECGAILFMLIYALLWEIDN